METSSAKKYRVVHLDDIPPTPCPCGLSRRAFVDDEDRTASLHVVDIKEDSESHYHKKLTEIYYVLEGEGVVELDGERVSVRPGSSVLIKPGCRHRAVGRLKLLNVVVPAFDPDDEWK
ncbi:MAG: cupin domain-containing protein [Planctomycetota bacterium]|nr:cupin domain-containing protein [Planctomycetota bacterium]